MNDKTEYAFEFDWFRKIRSFKDGVSFFELTIKFDKYKADHNPQFNILFMIFNFKIFEFTIYNTLHVWDDNWGGLKN